MDLTAENILNCDDSGATAIEVPEWGGTIYIRQLRGRDREWFHRQGEQLIDTPNWMAQVVARGVCNSKGAPLFTDEQVEQLGDRNGTILQRLFEAILDHNGLSEKSHQELEGNSDGGGTDDST